MLQIIEEQLMFIARRWARRGKYTSVERFLDFWPDAHIISHRDILQRPYRLLSALAHQTGRDGYTSYSAGLEMAAMVAMVKVRPQLVHFLYADHDFHYAGRLAQLLGARVVGSFHFSVEEFERRIPEKSFMQTLDLVLASGRRQMDYLKHFVPPEKITFFPLGVDTDFFAPPEDGFTNRFSARRLLQVGFNRRDFILLKQIYQQLRQKYGNLELHLVGCQEVWGKFGDLDGLVFHPFLDDEELREIYQQSTLLLLPLLEGGSSNALNEALATGLPVVATHMPNLEDYAHPSCVFLSRPENVDLMLNHCQYLLESFSNWKVASQVARQESLKLSWKSKRQCLIDIYQDYLSIKVNIGDI